MSITYEQIQQANQTIKRVDIKGKQYAQVPGRIQAFRSLWPEGSIQTEIISMMDDVVVMKATISDETGRILATGMAYEKESSSYINKTSYIENCETSAVGRALGMLGIGSEDSVASSEEVTNAINNQHRDELITEKDQKVIEEMCKKRGWDPYQIFVDKNKAPIWPKISKVMYTEFIQRVSKDGNARTA